MTPELGNFCEACQAIPIAGFCWLAGCPNVDERGKLRMQGYEFMSSGRNVIATTDSGGVTIATAIDEDIAAAIAVALSHEDWKS